MPRSEWDAETLEERPFDIARARAVYADANARWAAELARAGEQIRVGYRGAGGSYGMILSVDGRGTVTLHLPRAAGRAVALRGGATVLLDSAYELDDAPLWERFYLVTAAEAFETTPVVEAARRSARDGGAVAPRLDLPAGLEQSAFVLEKGAR